MDGGLAALSVPPDRKASGATSALSLELSVVMPCLNEADTIASCIRKASAAMDAHAIAGEIIVADNGSTDGSQTIAESLGARVVSVPTRGYGAALIGGIAAARGRFIIMGDADDSYDFGELPKFVFRLREGFDLVQGCRLPSGGGTVAPGAMPVLHRWWGNPMFSSMARLWFRAPVHDVYCGLRGFTREFYDRLDQRSQGMEFATEMIIKASVHGARIAEVPITLHPDGRKSHAPHLRTFRDGWRTLRFFLMYSPRWLFLVPGVVLLVLGAVGYAAVLGRMRPFGVPFDVHTLLVASLAILAGHQAVVFAVATKVFAIGEGMLPKDERLERMFAVLTLERGLVLGACLVFTGLLLVASIAAVWWRSGFGPLQYADTMRVVIPGVTLAALGLQTMLSSFFISLLGTRRR